MGHLRTAIIVVLTALVSTLVVGLGSPARAVTTSEYRNAAYRTINHIRANRDLHELAKAECLQQFARQQARRMARKKIVYHQVLHDVQAECGLEYVGEALVAGYKTGRGAVRRGLMKSAPHREILLDSASRKIGVGAKKARGGGWYLCVLVGHA